MKTIVLFVFIVSKQEDKLKQNSNSDMAYLYRLLRDDERPTVHGLSAKNPLARYSVPEHIENGSQPWFPGSQYISCSSDLNAVYSMGQDSVRSGHSKYIRICVIHRASLKRDRNIQMVDTQNLVLAKNLPPKARRFTMKQKEVLVVGNIPTEYILGIIPFNFEPCQIVQGRRRRCGPYGHMTR